MNHTAGAIAAFHKKFYRDREKADWKDTRWAGIPVAKNPLDAWVLQEIIWETKPTLIVETGTYYGGSALFMAIVLDMIGAGRIITLDVEKANGPKHPRISYVRCYPYDVDMAEWVRVQAKDERTMVILDSDHRAQNVTWELEQYAPIVSPGCYLVVEDTNVGGHPIRWDQGAGPMEAVVPFLAGNTEFERDRTREKYLLTFSPSGWLRRREE